MKLVFVCSPYRGNVAHNTNRAKGYCRFVQMSGHVPFAPHLHNTQFLDENIPEERATGIALGLELLWHSDEIWVFGDKITEGMAQEIDAAKQYRIPARFFSDTCIERRDKS
jgi:hypothetical protein